MARGTCKGAALLAVIVLWTAAACSSRPAVAEVDGVVKSGGKPLPHVRVQFLPDPDKATSGPISTGTTDEEGRFKLVCADGRAGAVVGWHRVVITDMGVRTFKTPRDRITEYENKGASKQKAQANRVPDRYTTTAQTPLSREVKPDKQEMELELSR
jgi:hypothetical protein